MEINSKELAYLTGATYRQIDYWCRAKVICPIGENTPGSGGRRIFEDSVVGPTRVLVTLSKALGKIDTKHLKDIYNSYEYGSFDMGNGVTLNWEMNDER